MRAQRSRPGSPPARNAVWSYIIGLVAIAVATVTTVVPGLSSPDPVVPWWVLAVVCAVAESFVINLRFGRETWSVSPDDVVLAVGLVLADPVGLVAARLIGAAVGLVRRRTLQPAKVLFNLAVVAVETVIGLWVFDLATPAGSAIEWRAVLLATAIASVANLMIVTVLMRLHRRGPGRPADGLLVPLASTMTTASLGALAAIVLTHDLVAGVLLIVVGAVLFFAYRTYDRLGREVADKHHQASHDALTGLVNRGRFNELVAAEIAESPRTGSSLAVLLLDLNGFKEVNDTLGHHTGDLILQQVADRLRSLLPDVAAISRLGGDEFSVLLSGLTVDEALAQAQRTHDALEAPFHLDDLELYVGASIGVACHPEHADDAGLLVQRADVAMYTAKRAQSGCAAYDPAQDRHSHDRLVLAADLRTALADRALQVHYQPKADIALGEVVGVEGLVRWTHPTRGFVPPDEFIPIAERTGLIHEVTRQVLDIVLAQHIQWQRAGRHINVAVNVAASTILARGFLGDLRERLRRSGVHPSALTLEVTESQVMADPEAAAAVLGALRAMGVRVSVDDFGTGYSSLSQLKRLPVDELKIDRSFVMSMCTDEDDAVIVRSTIELAHNLGLVVVAEGVEDAETWRRLSRLGCETAQGYYLSRPVPADTLTAWMRSRAAHTLLSAVR